MAISASQFETVDGFSNGFLTHRIICQQVFLTALFRFFGWGGEDDDFFQRLASKVFKLLILVNATTSLNIEKCCGLENILDWIVELRI